MVQHVTRRQFTRTAGSMLAGSLAVGPAVLATGNRASGGQFTGRIKKAVKYIMITEKLSVLDKFKMLKDLGFDGVEACGRSKEDPKEFAKARDITGLTIHGVHGVGKDIAAGLELARICGADSVLVVAGRVNKQNSYDDVYKSTQQWIRESVPAAEKAGVKLLIENVWNNFLLSPLEMARYIDELDSPFVGSYFDVGNVVRFGWPQQWIRILGKRIGKLDIKEYSRAKQKNEGLWKGFQVEIGEGDCDWPDVRKALDEIGYGGWATAEVRGGDRKRMAEIAGRMDRVLDL